MQDTKPRKATAGDVPKLAEALTKAFEDDPVFDWLIPSGAKNRMERFKKFFAYDLHHFMKHDEIYTTDDLVGAAIWAPPGKWKQGGMDIVRGLPTFLSVLRGRLPTVLQGLSLIEKRHAKEPHYYLAVLGTEPDYQGKGVGSATMGPILERCDLEGIGAYLESSKERNVPYYRRHGFEVTEEVTLPKGPPLWLMWRDPKG